MLSTPMINSLIPQEAHLVSNLKEKSIQWSQEGCVSAHLFCPIAILASATLSFLNGVYYTTQTLCYAALGVITCNQFSHLSTIPSLLHSTGSSFLFSVLGVLLCAFAFLFPQTTFSYFIEREPGEEPPPAPQPPKPADPTIILPGPTPQVVTPPPTPAPVPAPPEPLKPTAPTILPSPTPQVIAPQPAPAPMPTQAIVAAPRPILDDEPDEEIGLTPADAPSASHPLPSSASDLASLPSFDLPPEEEAPVDVPVMVAMQAPSPDVPLPPSPARPLPFLPNPTASNLATDSPRAPLVSLAPCVTPEPHATPSPLPFLPPAAQPTPAPTLVASEPCPLDIPAAPTLPPFLPLPTPQPAPSISPRRSSTPLIPEPADRDETPPSATSSSLPYFKIEEPLEASPAAPLSDEKKGALPVQASRLGTISKLFLDDPNLPFKQKKYLIQMIQLLELFTQKVGNLEELIAKYEEQNPSYSNLLRILNSETLQPHYQDARGWYQHFIKKLDEFIDSPEYPQDASHEIVRQIRQLCLIRWTEMKSTTYFKEIIAELQRAFASLANGEHHSELPDLSSDSFMDYILALNHQIEGAPTEARKSHLALAAQKLKGSVGVMNFTGGQNTPNIRSIQEWSSNGSSRKVSSIRHGCPTGAGYYLNVVAGIAARLLPRFMAPKIASGEAIVPNYREMLKALREKDEALMYTCLQRNWEDVVENEQARVQALIDEQELHDNFFVLVQAMEGPLFERKGPYAKIEKFSELTKALCDAFKEGKSHVVPAKCLASQPDYCDAVLPQLFTDVRDIFFAKDEISSREEWMSFILLCYVFQRQDLQFRLERQSNLSITVKTNPCKDYLDRGGLAALCESMVNALRLGQLDNPEWMSNQVAHVMGPPIAVKKQGVIHKRLVQAKGVHKVLFPFLYTPKLADLINDSLEHMPKAVCNIIFEYVTTAIAPQRLARLRDYTFDGGWKLVSDKVPSEGGADIIDYYATPITLEGALEGVLEQFTRLRDYSLDGVEAGVR